MRRSAPSLHRLLQALPLVACAAILVAPLAFAADDVRSLRVHVLDCGRMERIPADELLAAVPDRPAYIDLVNRCFLVEHPKGRLLWDTGFSGSFAYTLRAWAFAAGTFWRSGIERGAPLPEQLAERGLGVDDVDYLALSHVHFDHAGGANAFAGSVWLVQQAERDWAFAGGEVERPHVDPALYADLEDARTIRLEGDHDVFGDGSVVILSTPGHTPGHQSLLLELPRRGPVVLSGDLFHNRLNREHRAPPSFNVDAEQTRRSMERVEEIVKRRGAELWIQHDPSSGPPAPALVE